MSSQSGVRVRLDLSAVETNLKRQFRWIYLSFDSFATIKDVKNHIRSILSEQSDPCPQIRLYLEEPYWLPASESVKILQNGDLIVVKKRSGDADADDESTTSRKRSCSATLTTERLGKVDVDVCQNGSSLPKKRRQTLIETTAANFKKDKVIKKG